MKHIFEAIKKNLFYMKVDPINLDQIADASLQEREGFGTGLDPQELPPVLRFIAKNGDIWLQYAMENEKNIPTGVIEFIPLANFLGYNPESINSEGYDLSVSPMTIIRANQQRIFKDARRFGLDANIIYNHGISMSRRGQGYGTLLLQHTLPPQSASRYANIVVSFPDAAKIDKKGKIILAPNENSFTVHLKAGFILTGVVDPPVYDETIFYYSFVRPRIQLTYWANPAEDVFVNLADGDGQDTLKKIKELTENHWFGTHYSKKTHFMRFRKHISRGHG